MIEKIIKYLLYFVLLVKIFIILTIIRDNFLLRNQSNELKSKIHQRKEVLHTYFIFSMYIIIVLLFNPFQKNLKLHNDSKESYHIQIALFLLGVAQMFNFDYDSLLRGPRIIYQSFVE